jgi:hypothetical protein
VDSVPYRARGRIDQGINLSTNAISLLRSIWINALMVISK